MEHTQVPCVTTMTSIYTLGGKFYQKLGEVWDHETKDFKVLYKPLYCCGSKSGSFEAHHLAVSTFNRWELKFTQVTDENVRLPSDVMKHLVPPTFVNGLTSGNANLPKDSRQAKLRTL